MADPVLLPSKMVIDVDTGIDDAHAIMLALSRSDVDVLAITCAGGNVRIDDVVDNTLRVLQICGRMDVPVFKGASRSLLGKVSSFDSFAGSAWASPVKRGQVQPEHAANALVRLVNQFPGEITLVALAPLTNIALAVNLDPDFSKKVKDVVIMGGNIEARGRVSPCAEFNFFHDPEAAHIVLGSMKSIRLLPFEVCCRHNLSWEFMEQWTGQGTPRSNFLRDSLEFDVTTGKTSGRPGFRTCDGLAMAVAVAADNEEGQAVVTEGEDAYATVELCGQLTRGQMVVDWAGTLGKEKNVRLVLGLDMARVRQLLLSVVSH
ncbi:nucleoside hydrolase-like [Babylonia areolata]|uniref:nucleoside hydrolase-like n=1 Tax=Babylonia areolata TaxID=304850 RepID=UPI003FCEF73D